MQHEYEGGTTATIQEASDGFTVAVSDPSDGEWVVGGFPTRQDAEQFCLVGDLDEPSKYESNDYERFTGRRLTWTRERRG